MQNRPSTEFNSQDNMEIIDEQKNGSQNSVQFTDFPDEILLIVNDHLPSVKDKVHLASVNRRLHGLFQSDIGKKEAKEAAEYAIYPTKENVKELETLLKACPAL